MTKLLTTFKAFKPASKSHRNTVVRECIRSNIRGNVRPDQTTRRPQWGKLISRYLAGDPTVSITDCTDCRDRECFPLYRLRLIANEYNRRRGPVVCSHCLERARIGPYCESCHAAQYNRHRDHLVELLTQSRPSSVELSIPALLESIRGFYPTVAIDNPEAIDFSKKETVPFDDDKRQGIKLGRILAKLERFKPEQISAWVERFRTGAPWKLWELEREPCTTQHYKDCHCWAGSCMTGDASHLTELYENNNRKIDFAIWFGVDDSGEKIPMARALIFESDCGKTALGRLYLSDSLSIPATPDTVRQSIVDANGWSLIEEVKVTLSHNRGDTMPYLDYTRFSRICDETIVLMKNGDYSTDQYGGDPSENLATCDKCGDCIEEEELATVHVSRRSTQNWCSCCVESHSFTYDGEIYCDSIGETITVPNWLV